MAAWGGRGAVQRGLDSVIMALYFVCFVTTLGALYIYYIDI
jgi:hypothetical protein